MNASERKIYSLLCTLLLISGGIKVCLHIFACADKIDKMIESQ